MPPEFPPTWHTINPSDAYFLGRLMAAGLAMPNEPKLSVPALEVADVTAPFVQNEIDRLVTAADSLASIPGISFAGLAHSQLAPSEECPDPLQIFIAPSSVKGLQTELTIGEMNFQCLINTQLRAPSSPRIFVKSKEGCFSSGPVSVATKRTSAVHVFEARGRRGEVIKRHTERGLGALVLQHEAEHGEGIRGADKNNTVRNWVSRDSAPEYKKLTPDRAHTWGVTCSAEQWQAFTRDPDYPLFDTEELHMEFLRGLVDHGTPSR
jgi:peptide deformylase